MKRLTPTLCFILLLIPSIYSQAIWQEHLSHDRRAYAHHGHYVVDGKVVLLMGNEKVPMNTLEVISGNTKKTQEIITEYFTFQTKTTRTGIDSKEILLREPYDYDINGYGIFSIYERDDIFLTRNIQGDGNPINNDDHLYIIDAYMSGGPLDDKECVTDNKERYYLTSDDQVIAIESYSGSFFYHEGLDGLPYQIIDRTISSITAPPKGTIEFGPYDMILNNPYEYQLIELEGTTMNRYSYEDFSFVRTDNLEEDPIDIQFIEGGFYYLTESNDSYIIYQYSDENSNSELFYKVEKSEEVLDFSIRHIEVIEDDIYFFGLRRSPFINERFSYVQRRRLNNVFTPYRKDIELTSVSVTRESISNDEFFYEVTYIVRNLSPDPINHFTLYSQDLNLGFGGRRYVKIDVNQELASGASYEAKTDFIIYGYPKSQFTFQIEGVDYGIDSDISNNSYTADVIILSSEDLEIQEFTISPNPSSEFISISGLISEIESITITDLNSRKMQMPHSDLKKIDISTLQAGQHWIQIETKTERYLLPFIKI